MCSKLILIFLVLNLLKMNIHGNDSLKQNNEEVTKPEVDVEVESPPLPPITTPLPDPSSVFEDNQNNQNYYPNGNVRFEVVGDTSHLFEPEDFQKVEVKPLRASSDEAEADLDHEIHEDIDEETENLGINLTESSILNELNSTNKTGLDKNKVEIKCNLKNITNETLNHENRVQLVNGTLLTGLLAESKANDCFVVMFYVPWCPFSARLAPYFNALPRAFTQLDILAFDVSKSTGYNTKFGANAVPMVIVFQQKSVVAKFNHTQKNFTDLIEFVSKNTGIAGNNSLVETAAADFEGPVPTIPVERFDYALLLSWIFLLFVAAIVIFQRLNLYIFIKRLFLKYFYSQHND